MQIGRDSDTWIQRGRAIEIAQGSLKKHIKKQVKFIDGWDVRTVDRSAIYNSLVELMISLPSLCNSVNFLEIHYFSSTTVVVTRDATFSKRE